MIDMKSFLRYLNNNRLYTFIELFGLAVSLAFVVYMGCYTVQQFGVAHQHPEGDRIYVLGMPEFPGLTWGFPGKIRNQFPEIEAVAEYYPSMISAGEGFVLKHGEEQAEAGSMITVDSSFFQLFPDYHFLMGGPEVLNDPQQIILSESFARKLFPDGHFESVILGEGMKVGAVIEDFDRSILKNTDVIVGVGNKYSARNFCAEFDQYGSCIPLVKVRQGADMAALYRKLEKVCLQTYPDMYGKSFFGKLQLTAWNQLYFSTMDSQVAPFRTGSYTTLLVLAGVALLLLLSAALNFINLNAALLNRRAQEMAMRRLLGSSVEQIMGRYFVEATLLTGCAMGFALLLAIGIAPSLNQLVATDIPVEIAFTPLYCLSYVGITLLVGGACALLPAFLASRYEPIDIVRGTFRAANKKIWSKIFICFQSALAVFLISMTLVMQCQFNLSLHRETNCDIQNKFCLSYRTIYKTPPFDLAARLRQLPCVKRIGRTFGIPSFVGNGQYSTTTEGDEILYRMYAMDSVAFDMMHYQKVKDYGTPLMGGVWFGQTAFTASGFTDENNDISNSLSQRSSRCHHTAGVIKDVPTNMSNIGEEELMLVVIADLEQMPYANLLIETIGDPEEARRQIMAVGREYTMKGSGYEVEPSYADFLDDLHRKDLEKTENQMRLIQLFMFLAVLISMLGLLAMSIYDARNRARDIAVRKVYGSTIVGESVYGVLSYMKLVLVSCIIALPFSVWAAEKYLEQFIVKIENYSWIYVVTLVLILLMALLTTIWQIVHAARVNPVEVLNKE